MKREGCSVCGRTCSHIATRWVLTEEGLRVLREIRSERSGLGGGADVGSEIGGAGSGLAAPASD